MIKTLDIDAKEWFDRANGNSYFSAIITINYGMDDVKKLSIPMQYGYGDYYKEAAFEALKKLGYFIENERVSYWECYDKHNIIVSYYKKDRCRKKDVITHGVE